MWFCACMRLGEGLQDALNIKIAVVTLVTVVITVNIVI